MYYHINDMVWKLHGLANMTPMCQQEPCLFSIRRSMALETNFGVGTIQAIWDTIPNGRLKVLTLPPNKFGEVVTNPINKVQYAHNPKFKTFLCMLQGFTHTSFGVGTVQPLLIKFI